MSHYDLAVVNATLVDGTGAPRRVTDVAVRGDRIARVGRLDGDATRVIDAWGKVLAPGFIDVHGHSDYSILADPHVRSKIHQGVTTEVGGNCGYHAAPIGGAVGESRRIEYRRSHGIDVDWATSAEYRARLRRSGIAINYAQQIGYNTLRSALAGDKARALSASEREALRDATRRELAEGAVGLSYGLAYGPACFSLTEELIDVADVAAEAGVFVSFHLRDEGDRLLEAIDEALLIGRESRAAVHIGHLKTFRRDNWHKIDAVVAKLDGARAAGMDLTVDRYPHLAMNTQMKFMLPHWAIEGGAEATCARLREPAARRRIADELRSTAASEGHLVLVSMVSKPTNKSLEGRFLDELVPGGDPLEAACDLLADEGEAVFATFFGMCPENLDRILALDYAMIASDSSVQAVERQAGGGQPHPRCFDTFPYFLAEWAIARSRLSLEQAVHRITALPARRARLVGRGLVAEDQLADLVIFDPDAMKSELSYKDPIRYPAGIETVVVNGTVVLDRGRSLEALPGQLLSPG